MPINFPNNPGSGETYAYNDLVWSWNSSIGAWERVAVLGITGVNAGSGIGVSGSTNVTISNTGVLSFGGKTGPVGAGVTSSQILYWANNDATGSNNFTFDGTDVVTLATTGHYTGRLLGPVLVPIKNTSGVSIPKGTPVYATGSVGASGQVEVAACDASNSAKMPAIGLADSTLAINDIGHAVVFGNLEQVDTSSYTINGTVYVASGGGLTGIKPTGANDLIQNIGRVIRVQASTGDILVSAIGRSNDVPNILQARSWLQMPDGMTATGLVKSFNGLTGAVTGVGSFNGSTGTVVFSNYVSSFNGLTGAVSGVTAVNAGSGISISGTTNPTITNIGVTGFNGLTGNVTGVTSTVAGTGISISGTTRPTITNTGVQSFNGLTGAVSGVTTGTTNTFTALQTFNAGITASGATFNGNVNIQATKTLTVDNLTSNYGNTLIIAGDRQYTITTIGDVNSLGNSTYISVNDDNGDVTINAPVSGVIINGTAGIALNGAVTTGYHVTSPDYIDNYSNIQTYQTTTTATTANQTIATISSVYDNTSIPAVMVYPAFEITISARDTVANKTEMVKMLVVQDGTNTTNTQYGIVRTGTAVASSYTTTLSGSPKNLLIRATPSSTNSTKFTVTVRAHNG